MKAEGDAILPPQMNGTAKRLRDAAMFALGAGGVVHEVVVTKGERPTLLLACLALMGLPVFLRKDESGK